MLDITILIEDKNPTALPTAQYIKKLFESVNTIEKGRILIACGLTCYGFKEKDIDLFVIGKIEEGYFSLNLLTDYEQNKTQKIFINSFCFIVKEINVGPTNISIEENRIIIVEHDKEFDISSFSENQGRVIYNFLKGTTGIDIYTFDMLFFKNLRPSKLLNRNFKTLRPNFSLTQLFQNNIDSGAQVMSNKGKTSFNLYAASKEKLDLDKIYTALLTFGHIKKSIGKLTKRKINLLSEQILKGQDYAEQIGKRPIIIRGPAGSGKTMKLIGIAKDLYLQNKRCYFLTYNQSLVKDLTRLITIAEIDMSIPDPAIYADSIHSFLYRISKQFGILSVISRTREIDLKLKYEEYRLKVFTFFNSKIKEEGITENSKLRTVITKSGLDKKEIERLMSFLNYCERNNYNLNECDLLEKTRSYYEQIFSTIRTSLYNNTFINNYFLIRKQVLCVLMNDLSFFTENDQVDLKDFVKKLTRNDNSINDDNEAVDLFKRYLKTTIKRLRIWDFIFIDEAQDWHREEREIIYSIFGISNIIISDGLKQQLIRSSEYLDWGVFNQRRILTHGMSLSKSLRQKENLSKFQNAFAKATNVLWFVESDVNLEKGRIIISTIGFTKEIYYSLNQIGLENECDSHDSLMFLIPPSLTNRVTEQNILFDENDNLKDEKIVVEREFVFKKEWEDEWKVDFWDGTFVDKEHISKRSLPLPMNEQHRIFNYESSRGLEAWTVVCLDMDKFFERKMFYFSLPEGQQTIFSKEEQAKSFAANWCLIGMSRAVDTLVITIENKNSELYRILKSISKQMGDSVTWIE